MEKCSFDPNKCPIECKKFPICSYYSMQNQISDLQSQVNFLYKTLTQLLKNNEKQENRITLLENGLYKFGCELYRGENNEKENK